MKKMIVGVQLLFVTILLNACAASKSVQAEVVKDCTGVYVRVNNEDFFVCNKSVLADKDPGTIVKVKMNDANADDCEGKNDIVCMMYHEHKGIVKVSLINN